LFHKKHTMGVKHGTGKTSIDQPTDGPHHRFFLKASPRLPKVPTPDPKTLVGLHTPPPRRFLPRHGPLCCRTPRRVLLRARPPPCLRLLGVPPQRRPAPAPRCRRGAAEAPRDAVLLGARDETQLRRRATQRHRLRDQVRRGLR
jgi:hypothetical protein